MFPDITKSPDEKYKKLLKGHTPKTIWTMKIQPTKKTGTCEVV